MTGKHTRTISPEKVREAMAEIGPAGVLQMAKKMRSIARVTTARGEIELVPSAAHEVDAIIAELEAQLN